MPLTCACVCLCVCACTWLCVSAFVSPASAGCALVSACVHACMCTHTPPLLLQCALSLACSIHCGHSPKPSGLTHPAPTHPRPSQPLTSMLLFGVTHHIPHLPHLAGDGKAGVSPVPGGSKWEEVGEGGDLGALWRPKGPCSQFHPGGALPRPLPAPFQLFTDAQQLQPLQVYQAPLSLATVPHQALGRTQSSPAAPGSMKSPPDQPTKHLFTTGKPHHCPIPSFRRAPGAWMCSIHGPAYTLHGRGGSSSLPGYHTYSWEQQQQLLSTQEGRQSRSCSLGPHCLPRLPT